jgi:GST-like protein
MRPVPALIAPDGEVLTESAANLIWLAEKHPEAALGPEADDPRRGQFLRWMAFIPGAIYAMYWVRDTPSRLAGDDPKAQAEITTRTAERIAECWGRMEDQLTPDRFLLGPRPTVLDLYVAVASRWTPRRARFHAVAPRMGQVVRRVDALPELQAFWAERFPFAANESG